MTDPKVHPLILKVAQALFDNWQESFPKDLKMTWSEQSHSDLKNTLNQATIAVEALGVPLSLLENPCAQNAKEGEPVFILLGRDPEAPAALKYWAGMRQKREPESTKSYDAWETSDLMDKYRNYSSISENWRAF